MSYDCRQYLFMDRIHTFWISCWLGISLVSILDLLLLEDGPNSEADLVRIPFEEW